MTRLRAGILVLAMVAATGATASHARAQAIAPTASAQALQPAGQGVAVLAIGSSREAREGAFSLGRAIYGSRLRPTSLDEVRARMLAGGPLPANASRELRELAEVRAAVTGDDAAARRLLTGIAQTVGARALLVVTVEGSTVAPPTSIPTGPPVAPDADAGPDAAGAVGNAATVLGVVARLFHTDPGEFDAARYLPETGAPAASAWKSTVTSLEGRFLQLPQAATGSDAATRPAVNLKAEEQKSKPFYASGWFWGALAGAALLGGIFYFASRDTSEDPIHLQMRVPR